MSKGWGIRPDDTLLRGYSIIVPEVCTERNWEHDIKKYAKETSASKGFKK